MLKIQITKRVYKLLGKLPLKHALQLKNKLLSLQANPFPPDSKSLIGYPDYYRVTAGEYRIVYRIENNTLLVPLIGKRNDGEVYKKLNQIL